jgi:hypothetical protein
MLEDPVDSEPVLRDSSDDYLIELARVGEGEAIVTGDKDLRPAAACDQRARGRRQARVVMSRSGMGRSGSRKNQGKARKQPQGR